MAFEYILLERKGLMSKGERFVTHVLLVLILCTSISKLLIFFPPPSNYILDPVHIMRQWRLSKSIQVDAWTPWNMLRPLDTLYTML
jgi:hypothetical protein